MKIGINASRAKSGGAITHLIEFISRLNPEIHKFTSIHLWTYKNLIDKLPDKEWLHKYEINPRYNNVFLSLIF